MANFVSCGFTNADGTALTSYTPNGSDVGATITAHPSYSGSTGQIISNRARPNANTANVFLFSGTPASADYTVGSVIRFVSSGQGDFIGHYGRMSASADTGYLAAYYEPSGQWNLFKFVAGAPTGLGTFTQALSNNTNYLLELVMTGTSIEVFVDGVSVIGPVTDSSISAAGKAGIYVQGNDNDSTGMRLTDLTAGTSGSALASGVASFVSSDDSDINVTSASATGGTSPYTYQWHRSTTSGFTPGGGNALSGATSLSLSDSTASPNTVYFYKLVSTDSAAASVTSNQIGGSLVGATINVGFIGDSITDGSFVTTKPGTLACGIFQMTNVVRNAIATNHGVPSSSSNDWIGGSTNLGNADTAFAAAGVTVVMVMLGTNDAGNSVATSPATYASNIASLCAQEIGLGRTVILNYPPAFNPSGDTFPDFDQTALARLETYLTEIDSLVNGTTILRGDQSAFSFFASHQDQIYTDGVHLTNTGNANLSDLWASALNKAINPGSGSSTLAIAY